MPDPETEPQERRGVSRRAFLGVAAGGAAAIGIGGLAAVGALDVSALVPGSPSSAKAAGSRTYPFAGPHQAGIVTPAQDRMYTAAFDLTTTSRDELIELLRRWTTMSARLMAGLYAGPNGPASGAYDAPPDDTGEAMDLPAAGLTLTIGFGRSLFTGPKGSPADRFGIADRLPTGLVDLPHFSGDRLDGARSDGDLFVQACADDPQIAMHAVRNLTRTAFGTARVRWSQLGFGRTSSTSTAQVTPRNLMGFKDGTANVKAEATSDVEQHVWVQPGDAGGADWLTGGSYAVVRRIRMHHRDLGSHVAPGAGADHRADQGRRRAALGRNRVHGDRLRGTGPRRVRRWSPPTRTCGSPTRRTHGGAKMLRRGYNFTDGNDALGRLDAGLFFVAFVRDPRTGFIPVQSALSSKDALMEYLVHTGSGLYAVPPGVPTIGADGSLVDDAYLGAPLFA